MQINSINTTQNFGMPIKKGGFLSNIQNDYLKLKTHITKDSYNKPSYIVELCDKLDEIDKLSDNFDVDIIPVKKHRKDKVKHNVHAMYPHNNPETHYYYISNDVYPKITPRSLDNLLKNVLKYKEKISK